MIFITGALAMAQPAAADIRPTDTGTRVRDKVERKTLHFGDWVVDFLNGRPEKKNTEQSVRHAERGYRAEILESIKPNQALTAKVNRRTSPRRVAALSFAEQGRRLVLAGDYARALFNFERALGLEPVPYFYFYLAKTHYHLANHRESLHFLDVAASWLQDSRPWMSEILALQKHNRQALTQLAEAKKAPAPRPETNPQPTPPPMRVALSFPLVLLLGFLVFTAAWSLRLRRAFS